MPRTLYQLEGQQLRLLRSRVQYAKDHLIEIASDAGDVPEWNRGGHGYQAAKLLDEATALIDDYLKSSETRLDEED